MTIAQLRQAFERLAARAQPDVRPLILDIAGLLIDLLNQHTLSDAEIRTMIRDVTDRMTVAIADAIDAYAAGEALRRAAIEERIVGDLELLRDELHRVIDQLQSISALAQRLDDLRRTTELQYAEVLAAIARAIPPTRPPRGEAA